MFEMPRTALPCIELLWRAQSYVLRPFSPSPLPFSALTRFWGCVLTRFQRFSLVRVGLEGDIGRLKGRVSFCLPVCVVLKVSSVSEALSSALVDSVKLANVFVPSHCAQPFRSSWE